MHEKVACKKDCKLPWKRMRINGWLINGLSQEKKGQTLRALIKSLHLINSERLSLILFHHRLCKPIFNSLGRSAVRHIMKRRLKRWEMIASSFFSCSLSRSFASSYFLSLPLSLTCQSVVTHSLSLSDQLTDYLIRFRSHDFCSPNTEGWVKMRIRMLGMSLRMKMREWFLLIK